MHNYFYIGQFEYKGKRYERGQHQPIVEPDLFFTVQKRLAEQFISRPRTHKFTFLGLIKCAHCGCSVTAEIQKGKYVYYHCTGKRGGTCKKKFIREEKIEAAFVEMLKLQKEYTDESAEALEKKIKTLRSRLNNLYIDKIDGIISQEFYSEKKNLWQSAHVNSYQI